MQMHDEIAHMGVVDGAMGRILPRVIGLGVIGVDADDVDRLQIREFDLFQ